MAFPHDGKKFQKGVSGNSNGRPKRLYTILKKSGYQKDEIRDAYNELAWANEDRLKAFLEDPNMPAIIKVISNAFIKAINKGDYRYVKEIIEQVIGKAKETSEIEVKGNFSVTFNLDNDKNKTDTIELE